LSLSTQGCDSPSAPEASGASDAPRLREIERRMKASLPKTEERALAQKVDAEQVRKAQTELRVLNEYLDEPSGTLDAVTVNAVEAFQRRIGLPDDGLLDARTLRRLGEEAEKAGAPVTRSPP
jgi:peptidoglycan hydrolase-like protein with peptidoglycan-binding domain